MNKNSPLWPIWLAVLWIAAPLCWRSIFTSDYVFYGAHGLQKAEISGPILAMIFCWALLLSVRKFRVQRYICGAGGFLLATSFFLAYYKGFEHTGWLVLSSVGFWLLSLPAPIAAEPHSMLDKNAPSEST